MSRSSRTRRFRALAALLAAGAIGASGIAALACGAIVGVEDVTLLRNKDAASPSVDEEAATDVDAQVDRDGSVPIVTELGQDLVRRLDEYEFEQAELLARVVGFIDHKIMLIVIRHAISGVATVNSEDALLNDPHALAMLIDIFSERGYHALVDLHRIEIPEKVDLQTGAITCREKKVFRITIRFKGSEIRRG